MPVVLVNSEVGLNQIIIRRKLIYRLIKIKLQAVLQLLKQSNRVQIKILNDTKMMITFINRQNNNILESAIALNSKVNTKKSSRVCAPDIQSSVEGILERSAQSC